MLGTLAQTVMCAEHVALVPTKMPSVVQRAQLVRWAPIHQGVVHYAQYVLQTPPRLRTSLSIRVLAGTPVLMGQNANRVMLAHTRTRLARWLAHLVV